MRHLLIISILALILAVRVQASSLFQASFTSSHQQLEDDIYQELNQLLLSKEDDPKNPDDAAKNCKSCINLLKMTKRFCYFPESIQLAAMTNVCKRSKQVDNQVVRQCYCVCAVRKSHYMNAIQCEGMVREQGPIIRKVLRVSAFLFDFIGC